LGIQPLAGPKNEKDCGHRQSQEPSDNRRLQPT
jgi:hypothetical protein